MLGLSLRRAFAVFHATLGLVVLVESVQTVLHALGLRGGAVNHHLVLLALVEAIGAALFLFPPTLSAGGIAMLATFAVAVLVHASRGEFLLDLLVFAAGTLLVMARAAQIRAGARE
jgi:hypothetical protein